MGGQSPSDPGERTAARRTMRVSCVLVILLTAYMVVKFLNGDFKDAEVWYDAGRRVLSGESLANLPHYRYPPTFAVLVAPLTFFGFGPFFFSWYAINLLLFRQCGRLARGICSSGADRSPARRNWLPLLMVAPFAVDDLVLGQTNILITALLYWTFLADARNREWLAGLPLGAAIAVKVFPVPLLVYFAYRLRLRVVASALLACALLMIVIPAPARGFRRNLGEVGAWGRRVVMPFVTEGKAGDWGQHSLDFGNQSLPAVARRYLTHVDAQVMARQLPPIYVNLADLSESQVNSVVLGIFAILCATFAVSCGLRRPDRPEHRAVEYSLATILLLMASALSWTYFFVMLLLPVTAALQLLRSKEKLAASSGWALRAALWGLALATVLLVNHHARALGNLFWAAVLFFVALAMACRDLRRDR